MHVKFGKRNNVGIPRRLIAAVLCLCTVLSAMGLFRFVPSVEAAAGSPTSGVTRQADPSTMDTYKEMLDFSSNTRYAGRLWSDKSVYAYGYDNGDGNWNRETNVLTLNMADDGVSGTVPLDADFLHVYSVLGSSQNINTENVRPLDVVLLLDISTSMATDFTGDNDPLHQMLTDANELITTLMNNSGEVTAVDPSIHSNNRVGVVVYGGGTQILMPLSHYKVAGAASGTGVANYLTVSNKVNKVNGDGHNTNVYFPQIRANFESGNQTSGYMFGDSTFLQGALYQGMNMLAEASFGADGNNEENRIPVLIVLSDGGTNVVTASTVTGSRYAYNFDGNYAYNATQQRYTTFASIDNTYTWDNPYHGIIPVYSDDKDASSFWPLQGNPVYGSLSSQLNDDNIRSAIMMSNLMLAGSMQKRIEEHYNTGVAEQDKISMYGYSILLNSRSLGDNEKEMMYTTLDPANYLKADSQGPSGAITGENNPRAYPSARTAYNWLANDYIGKTGQVTKTGVSTWYPPTGRTATFNFGHLNGGNEKYDITALSDLNYIDHSYKAESANLKGIFDEILEQITTNIFSPVAGENDLGVENSVTYMDPVGKYMDVKDVKKLVLFGNTYDITETAVYSYEWNDAYMVAQGGGSGEKFKMGWYLGEPGSATFGGSGSVPTGYSTAEAEKAWDAGWVYRLDAETAAQFVPTLKDIETVGDAGAKQRATEYTFYRIAEDDIVRKELHMNPAYLAEGQTEAQALVGKTYQPDGSHQGTPGVYALADLRIWVEDTGDYSDPSTGGTETDNNFDEALWINIPVNMLPLRKITINEDAEGNFTYETNLGSLASFPLRVFYTVGVSDEALENGRVNIAGAISPEYINQNKITTAAAESARNIPQGNLEFFSNWYSPLNRYSDYVTTNTDYTYGDPVTSFSPSADNRYYAFEKALPLYSSAYVWVPTVSGGGPNATYTQTEGNWRRVTINEEGTDEETANFTPADFGGKLIAQDLEPTGEQTTPQQRQDGIWKALGDEGISRVHEGDMILLKNHLLTDVTKAEPDPFSSSAYYFLPIEFYELGAGGVATKTQYLITRKGSEFGSAYTAAKISNGDMLCWHDITGTVTQDYPYLSQSVTGDNSRGRDYIGTTIDPATGWYEGVDKGKAPTGEKSNADNNWVNANGGTWVVCAKPGGLRVGNLAQSVQAKAGDYVTPADMDEYVKDRFKDTPSAELLGWGYYEQNVTRTANNYYLPTISSSSGGDASSAVVNVYLGNNGRLYLPDTTLLVTKLIDPLEGGGVDNTQEFNYQVYIAGVTGTVDAVVVHYNENVRAWQRQFHYIDLELDQQLFLQTQDGQKAMVDGTGRQVIAGSNGGYVYADTGASYSGTRYYVYIGNNRESSPEIGASGTGFRVYHNKAVDGNGEVSEQDVTVDGTSGNEGTFKAAQVWLVSTEKYESDWNGQEVDSVDGHSDLTLNNFPLLTIDPNASTDTTEISISTPYLTASSYWTKQVKFGENANPDGDGKDATNAPMEEGDLYDPIIPSSDRSDYFPSSVKKAEIASHTAEFTLKHGEALLFSGIPSASVYRVTEKLTDAQLEAGYTLKEVSHNQQVGSVSTYRPGSQLLPVYYKSGYTYGEYGGGAYPKEYDSYTTEKGLMWALSQSGAPNDSTYLHYEPFFHTNAMVWEAYSTMDVDAQGDNHHQPSGVEDGVSPFWLWNETAQTSDRFLMGDGSYLSHDVRDNPSCKSLAAGGCDENHGDTVRHYFFKDGAMRDFHYEGEGSGYIRNVGRFITSPTVHFLVNGETQPMAETTAPNTKSNTDYVGVYSVFGNTGTFEESVNFVNTIQNDKTETQINGENVTASDEDRNTYPAVKVGDEITYEIKWANTTSSEAQVVIIDPLDEGADFAEASNGGQYFKDMADANAFLATIYTDPKNVVTVDSGHVVIWDLGKQPTREKGTVTLKVKVNEKAPEWWDYDGDGVADKPVDTPEGDYLVRNRATVRVADNAYNTNTVVNPLNQPSKTETNIEHGSKNPAGPGGNTPVSPDEPNNNLLPSEEDTKLHGPTVFPGDKITYEIEWRNYENEPATISIRDPLDDNVAFVSAEFDPTGFKPAPGDDAEYDPATEQSLEYVMVDGGDQSTVTNAPGYGSEGGESRSAIAYTQDDHTVTFNLGVVPAGASGKVTLVVQVLDSATPVGYVDNTAYVTVGQNAEQQTDTIENPTPEEKKTEVTPGDGVMVGVGDTITYQISWQNYKPEDARVVVMDTLDPGVTFESATGGEYKYYEKEDILPADGEYEEVKIPAHTVVWTLGVREGLEKGEVTLTVTVNEEAFRKYEYKDTADGFTPDAPSDELDYEVLNQARVKVDNDAFLLTQIVENPIPDKDETNVNHDSSIGGEEDDPELTPKEGADQTVTGPLVYVGDVITYTIHWTNGHNEAANVIIRDPLDPGVDFVEASFDTVKLTDAEDSITQDKVRISYDEATHTVTWILEDRAAKESDIVTLKVRVNEKATPVGFVDNQASVKVGTDPFVETKIIENPTPHMEKTEVHPGEGMQVMPGDKIDYKISWHNYEEGEADVIITDKLDPGVDFLSAGVNGNTLTNGETTMKPVTGNLTIMLSGGTGADPTEDITFTLTLKAPEGETLGTEYEWENSEGATGNWSESSKTFTLKPGQQITIKDLPVGTVYSLTANDQEIVKDAKLGTYGSAVTVTVTKEIRTLSELPTEPSTEEPTEPTVTPPAETNGPTESSPEETTGPTETPPEEPTDDGPAADEPTDDEPSTDEPQEISSVGVPIIDKPQAMRDEDEPTTGDATDPTDPVPGDATEPTDPALGEQDGDEVPSGTEPAPEPPERETDVVYSFSVEVHDYDAPTGGSHGAMPIAESAGFDKEKETYNGEDAAIHQIFTETSGKKVDIYYFAKAHVVVWVLHERPANAEGDVDLTVQVNADAEKFWSYDHPEYGPDETTRDDRVRNQAGVQVGNNPEIKTRIIENPTEPEKTETHVNDRDVSRDLVADEDGYIGPQVNVGDTITYKITWQNNASDDSGQPAEAEITITDVLDPGVEFVDASEPWTYDPDTHTVTWELGKKDPRDRGVVTLTVRVLSSALDGENTVENQATVTVGNNSTVTKWVENPVAEYGGLTVTKTVKGNQGDQEKLWHFTVTLSDTTLYGDYGEMTFNAGIAEFTLKHGESLTATGLPARITYTVEEAEANEDDYTTSSEGETGTIPAGDTAKAEFVNSKSTGPDPHKTEVTPGDRSLVEVGDEITYEITWQNYDPETANVVIRDPLDDGVDFVSASEGYTYDPSTRTVTWTFKADPNTDGVVSLTVQVNENAKVKGIVKNQAFVTVGNHPEVETEIPENPLPGGLIVTKVVTGAAGDTQKEWHFRVELSDKTINGQYGGMFFTDGVAEFTLKHGQSMSATRLPDGVTYTVTELEANQDGYTTRSTGAEGTIREGRFAEARFVNDKDRTPPPPTTPTGSTTPTTPDDTPKTGDSGNLGLWLMLLIVSLAGAAVTFVAQSRIGQKARVRDRRRK